MRFIMSLYLAAFLLPSCLSEKASNNESVKDQLNQSEQLINAFYSFEKVRLEFSQSSVPSIVFYQGWAEGGNYKIIKRKTCIEKSLNTISCSITVQDDLMLALGIDFNVTDTFEIKLSKNKIVSVNTSSNDLDIFWQAREWVNREHPELIDIPCKGIWNGGPTPADCVRAMVAGYILFAASGDFLNNKL